MPRLDDLKSTADLDSGAGAFTGSILWQRGRAELTGSAPAETAAVPDAGLTLSIRVLCNECDPTLPRHVADRHDNFVFDVPVAPADAIGHFTALPAPTAFTALLISCLTP